MNSLQNAFGKPINEITYSDIEDYFSTPQPESDFCEFKSFTERQSLDENIKVVHRAFCGLLNSGGGFIIWGAPEGVTVAGQPEKVFSGDLKPINEVIGKDRMVNKLADKIIPLPNSFKVEVIANAVNDKSIVVIEVEKSNYTPHQFSNTYFMRIDGQTRPAPHHYIEALFKQIKYPQIEAYIKFTNTAVIQNAIALNIEVFILNYSPLQNEENISITIKCGQGVFEECRLIAGNSKCRMQGSQLVETPTGILSYGAPLRFTYTIELTTAKLSQSSGQVDLVLQVVGKQSPSKISKYKLDFRSPRQLNTADLNRCIVEVSENNQMIDWQEQIGITKEEQLQRLLMRTPNNIPE